MSSRTASCCCGQLRIEVQGGPHTVGICRCLACQRRTGSVFAALAGCAVPYRVYGTATEHVRTGDRGARSGFRFCPVCGMTVFHREEGVEGGVGVAAGAFADPGLPAPRVSVYGCRRHPRVDLPPGMQAFEADPVRRRTLLAFAAAVVTASVRAQGRSDQRFPDVIDVKVRASAPNTFDFDVTVSSPYDTPSRYADGFRVSTPAGEVLGERKLLHDHQDEQPFTRDLHSVRIAPSVKAVLVQARDQKHGYGGRSVQVRLPGR